MRQVLLLLFSLLAMNSFAQNASISGKIVDEIDQQPLEYASVAIYNVSDSSLVNGGITSQDGNFKIENLSSGRYYIQAHFLGYESAVIDSFNLQVNENLLLGTIRLAPSRQLVDEINVTGNRINAMNRVDKQTYRAAQFESAKGGSAVDVLKNMPSIAVNGQGEISVRGSSGFLVLIDGKPVLSDAQTALGQLPANAVDNIELITSPSAKYDPDGKAGIINITTKKGTTNGSGLIVNAHYGLPSTTDFGNKRTSERFGGDITYNYQNNKWDISIGGNYTRNDLNGYRVGSVWIENIENNTINYFPSEGERSFNRYNYAGRANIQFSANNRNIFTLGVFAGKRYQERDADLFYNNSQRLIAQNTQTYAVQYYNANKQIKQGTFTLGNFDYTHIFGNNSSVTASFLYEYDDLYGTTHNRNFTGPGGENIQYVQNPYEKPIEGYRAKLDYSVEIGNGKLETGYQYRNDSQDGVFDYIVTPEDINQPDLDRFRGTAISENLIHSGYGQFSANTEKVEYIVGLRYEYSKRTVDLSVDPNVHVLELSNFFPSANLLYKITPDFQLKAGVNRRIQRSTNNQLNPIPEREHSETLEMGDPDLQPEFIYLGEIGITKLFEGGSSVFFTVYIQDSKNPVQRVNSVYADTILNRVYTNIENGRSVGGELGADLHITKWWDFYVGGNLYYQSYKGSLVILGASPIDIDNSGWVHSVNGNTTFRFAPTWSLQANVNYLSKRPTAQGEDSRYLIPNMSLKKAFLDNRLTATVQWQNIDLGMEQSHRQRISTWGKDFYTTTNYIYETDFVVLNLSYNFNWKNGKLKLPSSEFGEKEF
ncbi:TonB-dependent receptor [Maribellus comscasis]|uniref:TonB-dependent receptor n=1 Tax=Maribellus comscasis TaxID=2681766 RepID=A0A6I6JW38_9BACT|nr:TonB-dependent receptor [Maribellus comscasis]QGY47346.1 TonB-dependent receptor [Maribellus comscasis]